MINSSEYAELVEVLRGGKGIEVLPAKAETVANWWGDRPPRTLGHPRLEREPHTSLRELVAIWNDERVHGISLLVKGEYSLDIKVRCVLKCPTGGLQEGECSDGPPDYLNCWDALRFRCGAARGRRPRTDIGGMGSAGSVGGMETPVG
jgi:hypothetical protein